MKDDHAEIMQSLCDKHDVLAALIGTDHVHYLDVPMHRNIGDLLIMLGTLRFFKRHQIKVAFKAPYFSYRARWAGRKDVIVFQGGGNFGDLYEGPQEIRQRLTQQLPKNRIVILPQTIHFRSRRAYDECCSAFSRHPDLHICVRDHLSYELALPMSRNVYLLPDLAHQLWPIQRLRPAENRHLAVMRDDEERVASSVTGYDVRLDWRELVGSGNKYRIRIARSVLLGLYLARMKREHLSSQLDLWIDYAGRLVSDAVDLFSRFDVITTDRLHAHILACLMGIPNTVLNNSYGKNYSYVNAWTGLSNIVQFGQLQCCTSGK